MMNKKAIFLLPLFLLSGIASGQSLYLTCKATSFPELDFNKIYKSPPSNPHEQLIGDMLAEGLGIVIVNKAESWVIKTSDATIYSPEANSGPKFENASITETKISASATSASGTYYTFEVNRITGTLVYSIHLEEYAIQSWRNKHAGALPSVWEWELMCVSSVRPKV